MRFVERIAGDLTQGLLHRNPLVLVSVYTEAKKLKSTVGSRLQVDLVRNGMICQDFHSDGGK